MKSRLCQCHYMFTVYSLQRKKSYAFYIRIFIVTISTDEYFIEAMETWMENSKKKFQRNAIFRHHWNFHVKSVLTLNILSGSNDHPFLHNAYKTLSQKLLPFLSLCPRLCSYWLHDHSFNPEQNQTVDFNHFTTQAKWVKIE